eukprot:COSAG04_NODE_1329_length_7203_cov_11.591216_1_plen_934_part_10
MPSSAQAGIAGAIAAAAAATVGVLRCAGSGSGSSLRSSSGAAAGRPAASSFGAADALRALSLRELRERAAAVAAPEQLERALEDEDPKRATIELIAAHGGLSSADHAQLRAELESMRLGQLWARAEKGGVDAAALDAAEDSADPKAAMIGLILARQGTSAEPPLRRPELERLRPSALRQRARAAGAGEEEIEAAVEAADPKDAMVSLVLARLGASVASGGSLLADLRQGGEQGAAALRSSLEALIDIIEQQAAASPRKSRKGLRDLVDSAEAAADRIDADFCDGLKARPAGDLRDLSAALMAGDSIAPDEAVKAVLCALDLLRASARSGDGGAESDEMAELRSELQSMRMTALQKRAVSEGVSPEAIDDAMDGSDPKSSLVALIVDVTSMRGPADRMVMALCAGGESAADTLTGALDHAMDVLEHLSVSSPRKSRKSVRELLESFEELSESVDESWCDGVSRCGSDRLEALASDVVSVLGVSSGECGAECVSLVSSLLDSLRECGSVAVQCESLLGAGVGSEQGARLSALECVRGMSPAWLGRVDASEASLFGVLLSHVSDTERTWSCVERESCWLAFFVLGCRNGRAVVVVPEVVESVMSGIRGALLELAAASSDEMDAALRLASAAVSCWWMGIEGLYKSPPDVRSAHDAKWTSVMKVLFSTWAEAFTDDACTGMARRVVALNLLADEDLTLAAGAAFMSLWSLMHNGQRGTLDSNALFGGGVALLRRICPSPLSAEWWVSTCSELDATSVRLGIDMQFLSYARLLDQSTLESAPWLGLALAEAVHICKVNASADLSTRPTMSSWTVCMAFRLVEVAARVESHASSLLESGVIEALDYACSKTYVVLGTSLSSDAAGAVVALVGKNEGGKTLSRSTVNAVLEELSLWFDPSHWKYGNACSKLLPLARRIATMTIADANKKIMLQHDKLLNNL